MIELSLNNIEKFYGAIKILENVTFDVKHGERVGIIGKNGTGKTTIFKILNKDEEYQNGTLSVRKGSTIGYLDQIPDRYIGLNVEDVLYTAFSDITEVKNKMKKLESEMSNSKENIDKLIEQYGKLQSKYEVMGGYDIDEKISKICTGLKINDEFKKRSFESLSGGEKTTVVLGKILLQNPDILLLDEPTNHLDLESIEWLEEFLKEYKGTVLIISHDRYFLDKVVTKIFEVENGKINTYSGNYTFYLEEKESRFLQALHEYNNQKKKIDKMEEAIKRFRVWGAKRDSEAMYKKAKILERKLEKVDRIDKPTKDDQKIKISFSGDRSGKEVVKIDKLSKSFGENEILKNLKFNAYYKEKIGILGKNGSGKSTLIKLIIKKLNPDNGDINIGSSVKIGYLEQVVRFENEDVSILDFIIDYFNISEGKARNMLARFMFYKDDVFKKIKSLSGGEKSRLKLFVLMNHDTNLLILDEPTNHLDIDSREALEDTLLDFEGTIIFISHDRYFINKIASRIVELNNKKLDNYIGNYEYYKTKKKEIDNKIEREKEVKHAQRENKKSIKKNKNSEVDKSKKIKKQLEKIEAEISDKENMLKVKDIEMENYSTDHNKLNEIYEEKRQIQLKLDELLNKWTDLQEML